MTNMNKANRTCCDVDIRVLKTLAPYLFFEDANVTTFGFTADETYATSKGAKKIAFSNPMDGTMTIEAQVKPFKLYALLSDGVIDTTAVVAERKTISSTTAGELTLPEGVKAGSVFVYEEGDFGGKAVQGTVEGTKFSTASILAGKSYEVGYLIAKETGVQKISFNNKKNPQDYYITMKTVEKDESGVITPYLITGYKCKPKKALDLSFSSSGDAATVKIEFACLEDKDGNVADMVEYMEAEA
ncbi:MAG: hypothetical protein KIC73_16085 [Clostridiales bacterium]|nr:hypothetical protein [Clostridiales bacterium]